MDETLRHWYVPSICYDMDSSSTGVLRTLTACGAKHMLCICFRGTFDDAEHVIDTRGFRGKKDDANIEAS